MEKDLKLEMFETLQVLLYQCKTSNDPEVIKATAELLEAWTKFLNVI